MGQACRLVRVTKWCLRAWFTAACTTEGRGNRCRSRHFEPFPQHWERQDLVDWLRVDQQSNPRLPCRVVDLGESGDVVAVGSGPYYRIDGVVYLRSTKANGVVCFRAVVDGVLRDMILRDLHRANRHGSVETMCDKFTNAFHASGIRRAASAIKKHCAICARLNARFAKGWLVPCGGPYHDIRALLSMTPYTVVGIDFVIIAPSVKVMIGACIATRHVTLLYAAKEDSNTAVSLIHELSLLRGLPVEVFSDRASYFRSVTFQSGMERMGIKVSYLASHSPFEGSVYERRNRELKRVLRYLLELPSVKKLLRHFDPDSVEHVRRLRLVLLEIELMVNQRPLGLVDTGAEVRTISPDSLCYGYARRTDQVADPGIAIFASPTDEPEDDGDVDGILGSVSPYTSRPGVRPSPIADAAPKRLSAIRNSFLSFHFQYLKDRSDKAMARGAPQSSVMPLFGKDDLVFVRAGKSDIVVVSLRMRILRLRAEMGIDRRGQRMGNKINLILSTYAFSKVLTRF
ncbi:hypothetical protein FOZ61_004547 [Perkinsus olseni]|uniref:Integrase catalytic domain-containing protein n=1 Tax=Perkinsus olseni TaxID=32597 RepID=A0A7J6LK72_PEROL|nr:hypothetical protein FOZ61_004547 [Perkinsus olseni]